MSQQQINVVLVSIRDFPKKKGGGVDGVGGLENIFLYKRGARQKKFGNHCSSVKINMADCLRLIQGGVSANTAVSINSRGWGL